MSYRITSRNTITSKCDAVVNTTNQKPVCAPGSEMEIYRAAGFDTLLRERQKAGILSPGEVFSTPGFGLKAKTIFHVVMPAWNHTNPPDYGLIRKCYRNIFAAAENAKVNSLAMPVLGLEKYGFFGKKAMDIAIDETEAFELYGKREKHG